MSPSETPIASIPTSIGEPCRPRTNVWWNSSLAAEAKASPKAQADDPVARRRSAASIAYSVKCAALRSRRSQLPRWVLSDGIDENAKITPAQISTGSHFEGIPAGW